MKIGIDARLLSGKMTGISRYLWNVIKYIPQFDHQNDYTLFLHEDVKIEDDFYNLQTVKTSVLPRQIQSHFWLNFKLPKILEKGKFDIFFTPYILVPLKKGNYKNVIVIHDSMPKLCKDFYTSYYRRYMDIIVPMGIKRADAIVTVSKAAMDDLVNHQNSGREKTSFMHLWTDDKYKMRNLSENFKDELRKRYNLPEDFILYVGAIEKRKNIDGILKISDLLHSMNIQNKIVLVGASGYGADKIFPEIAKREGRVIKSNYIEEKDLPYIYNLAKIFLFPSYYEGFGLPPLEAMKSGIPVISSANSSLIEVIGEGGIKNNPDDHHKFANDIKKLLTDEAYYNQMSSNALEQAAKFKPELQIPKLVNVFESLRKDKI